MVVFAFADIDWKPRRQRFDDDPAIGYRRGDREVVLQRYPDGIRFFAMGLPWPKCYVMGIVSNTEDVATLIVEWLSGVEAGALTVKFSAPPFSSRDEQ